MKNAFVNAGAGCRSARVSARKYQSKAAVRSQFCFLAASACVFLCTGCDQSGTTSPKTEPAPVETVTIEDSVSSTPKNSAPAQLPEPVQTTKPPIQRRPDIKPAPKLYRRSDDRPVHLPDKLQSLGIRRFASKRCVLFTDIDPVIAATLPTYVDRLYESLSEYYGQLPPDEEGTEFQVTGYIMKDASLFKSAGLLPSELPSFDHGRHSGYEFWLNDQNFEYYRRHLMLHEATHCFMTCVHGRNVPPAWYMEGMAEWMATHNVSQDGKVRFGVMPGNDRDYRGFGRVRIVRDATADGGILSLNRLTSLTTSEFIETSHYAQSWAVCQFLNRHPRYRERFRSLSKTQTFEAFQTRFTTAFQNDHSQLMAELRRFYSEIENGFDFQRNAVSFEIRNPKAGNIEVAAEEGWQAACNITAGQTIELNATGRVVLANKPKRWESEAQGITIRYANGAPIGMLQASILSGPRFTQFVNIGKSGRITAKTDGKLFLRVNDFPSERSDNSGSFLVQQSATPR